MNPSEKRYRIVFQGKLVDGYDKSIVMQNFSKLYKSDPQHIEHLFSGKITVIKRHLSQEDAKKFVRAFTQAGAVVSLQAEDENIPAPQSPQPKPATSQTLKNTAKARGGMNRDRIFAIIFGALWVMTLGFHVLQTMGLKWSIQSYKASVEERDRLLAAKTDEAQSIDDLKRRLANCETLTQAKPVTTQPPSRSTSNSGTSQTNRETLMEACTMAKMLITQYIVNNNGFAEKSIKFPIQDCTETTKDNGDKTFSYQWTVKYKNAFNADMQSPVRAIVRDNGDGTWGLSAITFQ